ncbi:MAG: kelch repeat-containing protein [Chthoniobacterales bacterium]
MTKQTTSTIITRLCWSTFFLALLFLIVSVIPRAVGQRQASAAPAVCPNPWQNVASMPLDLYGAAGASNGTYSYNAGGYSFSSGNTLNVLNRYDPVANTWTSLAPMPQSAIMASAVYYPTTNKIYVFGGEDAVSGVNYNLTQVYDVASNTWSMGANMPDVRSFMASGYNSANGKIYLIAGYNTGNVTSAQTQVWEYDPVANTFTTRTPYPNANGTGGPAFGIINGHFYVAGGRDLTNTEIALVYDYNIAADTWTARVNLPAANNAPGSGVALNRLWVFGGGNPFLGATGGGKAASSQTKAAFARTFVKGQGDVPQTTNGTVVYDPVADSWSSGPLMNVTRSFPSGTAIAGKLIAAGGYNGSTTVASAETLDTCIPPPLCDTGIIQNEGFETGSFPPWVIDGTNLSPVISTAQAHTGTYSALAGGDGTPTGGCGNGTEPTGDSSFYQQFTVPAGGGTLSFWHWDCTTDSISFDWQDAYITDSDGTILTTIFHQCNNTQAWLNTLVDMTPYAGQTVRIKFLVHQDGFGDLTGMYVDDVALLEPCAPMAQSAFSRKVHGGAGTFDILLPLTGNVGVECRTGPTYQMIVNFATTVTVQSASVTSGTGNVSSFSGSGTSQITVNLTGVTDQQRITMTLHGVNDGTHMGDVPISLGVLIGDVNGNGAVSAADVALTKSQVGATVGGSNFREDVNVNGTISSTDVALVKSDVGHALPP